MFSAETRQHLVRMVCLNGKNVTDAANSLRLSERSTRRFLHYFTESGGEFHHDPEQWNRHADNVKDDPTLRDAVLSAVREQPEIFMDELAEAVNALTVAVDGAVQVSPASVGSILARNGYTRKIIENAFFFAKRGPEGCVGGFPMADPSEMPRLRGRISSGAPCGRAAVGMVGAWHAV